MGAHGCGGLTGGSLQGQRLERSRHSVHCTPRT
jgi:hypothetical protein